jgi:tryptophan synthase alpha chain
VGLPYSDPVMDGSVIQAAVVQALSGGMRVHDIFDVVHASAVRVPTVVMTSWNPVERFGVDAFAEALREAGGAGLITPDITPDEAGAWVDASQKRDLDRIFLVAPSSTDARIAMTAAASSGFVYATAVMGVTGARASTSSAAPVLVERVRKVSDIPVGVGLGISNGAQAAEVAGYADAVIVGSALVRALGAGGVDAVRDLAKELRAGVERA